MSSREQEANFRRAGRIASGVTVALGLIALVLAFRGDQVPASIVLTFALISLAVTWLSYRRYQSLRGVRWKQELANTEAELGRLLASGERKQVGTRRKKKVKQDHDHPEETPLARP
ncbi:MAG: hypothetical protein ABIO92_10220 [Chloroflexia bacterium]